MINFLKYFNPLNEQFSQGPERTVVFGPKVSKKHIDFTSLHNVFPLTTQVISSPLSQAASGPSSTIVLMPTTKSNILLPETSSGNVDNVTIVCYNVDDGILVEASKFPDNFISCDIVRESLFASKTSPDRFTTVAQVAKTNSADFIDTEVIPGKTYRYFAIVNCLEPIRPVYQKKTSFQSNEMTFDVCEEEQGLRIATSFIAARDAKIKRKPY